MPVERWNLGTTVTITAPAASLADAARKGAAFANGTNKDIYGDLFLSLKYDTSAPAAGTKVAEVYLLPGNGDATELFPEGGDGTVGSNVDPQKVLLVGALESRNPSTTVNEVLTVPGVVLPPGNSRIVLKNTSGKTINSNYALTLKPYEPQWV